MRWSLWAVRAGIVAVSLFLVVVVVLSVVPLASGALKVETSDPDDSGSQIESYENGVVTVSIPLAIYNGGYFDIKDLKFHITVMNDGKLVVETSSQPTNVVAGNDNEVVLELPIDLSGLDLEDRRMLVFEGADLDIDIRVEAAYALGLASASIEVSRDMEWDPLVRDVSVDAGGAWSEQNGTNRDVHVPYSFQVSSVIQGATVDLHATLSNASGELARVDRPVVLTEHNHGVLTFVIPESVANELRVDSDQEITVGLDIAFSGAVMHQDFVLYGGAGL